VITHIKIENFKSLRSTDISLGNLNLFIGTNASGKSNFLDALRFLQGVGYGFAIGEILNGKPKTATSEVWEGIRGGSTRVAFVPKGQPSSNGGNGDVTMTVDLDTAEDPNLKYTLGFSPRLESVRQERLRQGTTDIYDSTGVDNPPDRPVFKVRYYPREIGQPPFKEFEKGRSVLAQAQRRNDWKKEHRELCQKCAVALGNVQRLDPSPKTLREYSSAQSVKRMGERGELFAALVKTILDDPGSHDAYLSWLRQLTPTELDDVTVVRGALDEPLFAIKEGGIEYAAPVLSDGTLRFAAIAAAFFQPDMPDVITVEEIENGVHPSRLRLLVELLRSQSKGQRQVMATTHSPIVLAWLKEEDYSHTFVCKRDETTGESVIRPLTEVPGFLDIVRKQPISDLFAEGWLETAL
jgi:energy-coupling factor transporter ATP-binding protein EcfA2